MNDAAVLIRRARREDVAAIVAMLADDPLGATREDARVPLPAAYAEAFDVIDADANNELVVATFEEAVIGVLQLTLLPSLTYRGSWRAHVEGVRVARAHRSRGVGGILLNWAVARARERRCVMLQLTTDKARPEALRFYEDLGFRASHEGMKLRLDEA